MPRRTIRATAEDICRTLQGPIHIRELVRRVVESLGIEERPSTEASVREALGRFRFMVRSGPGLYAPARVVLDGKAFRLKPPPGGWGRMLSLWQLEPFASALENAGVVDQDGRPLSPNLRHPDADAFEQQLEARVRRRAAEIVDFFLAEAGLHRALSPGERQRLLDDLLRQVSEERGTMLQGIAAAMAPYRLPDAWDEDAELIVRYEARSHALRITPERPAHRDEQRIRSEDRRFCDFVASQLREGSSVALHDLVLQAYAQIPGFGEYPGSPPHLAVAGDPRIRILGSVSTTGAGDIVTNPAVAKADDVALLSRLEGWRAESGPARDAARRQRRVELQRTLPARIQQHLRALAADLEDAERRLGLGKSWRQAAGTYASGDAGTAVGGKGDAYVTSAAYVTGAASTHASDDGDAARLPGNEALLTRWDLHLQQQGLSDRARARKLIHLGALADYLASGRDLPPTTLAGATGAYLRAFFFWTYVRRYPCSPSDAEAFTLDVRDFYRWLEQEGLLTDSRFAELPYRLRHHVAERIRLYMALDPDDPAWEPLFEMLFLSGPL